MNSQSILNFGKRFPEYTFFLVDDGSKDSTLSLLEGIERKMPVSVFVIKNNVNRGKAESVRLGMLHALNTSNFEHIGFLDADFSTPLEEFNRINICLRVDNKKAVFGSRLKRAGSNITRSGLRHFIGRVFATLIAWTIGHDFYDTQCGAKVFHASILEKILEKPFKTKWLFDVEIIKRIKTMHTEINFKESILEFPLLEWREVKGSKIGLKECFSIPIELLKIMLGY